MYFLQSKDEDHGLPRPQYIGHKSSNLLYHIIILEINPSPCKEYLLEISKHLIVHCPSFDLNWVSV